MHRVKWFDPQATDGALGSVEHSYDPSSAYQRVGTIVIGLAPLLAGAGGTSKFFSQKLEAIPKHCQQEACSS